MGHAPGALFFIARGADEARPEGGPAGRGIEGLRATASMIRTVIASGSEATQGRRDVTKRSRRWVVSLPLAMTGAVAEGIDAKGTRSCCTAHRDAARPAKLAP